MRGALRGLAAQVSYAIGVAQPLSVHVDTYGTGVKPDKQILASVLKAFDFRPGAPPPQGGCHSMRQHAAGHGLTERCQQQQQQRVCGRAGLIARDLDLFRARYKETAAYGHFGRDNLKTFTWEKVKPLQ